MKRVLLMTVAGVLVASSAFAGHEDARFALHAKASFTSTKAIPGRCDSPATITEEPNYSPNFTNLDCKNYTVQAPAGSYSDVYVVVGRAGTEGVAGVGFGIDYSFNAIDPQFIGFFACADGLSVPNSAPGRADFPDDGGGLRITWLLPAGCQQEVIGSSMVHAVVGAINVYGYDGNVMSITPNNNLQSGPELAVTNCAGVTTLLTEVHPDPSVLDLIMGKVGFGSALGFNSCVPVPTRPTTWGKIKTQYSN